MHLSIAIEKINEHRQALLELADTTQPTLISENIQALAMYTGVAEDGLGDLEEATTRKEAQLFNKYRAEGQSVNAAKTQIEYDLAEDRAKIKKYGRLISSSWKIIGASQSRIKMLIAEAQNLV